MLFLSHSSLPHFFLRVPQILPYSNPTLFQVHSSPLYNYGLRSCSTDEQPWEMVIFTIHTSYLKVDHTNVQFPFSLPFFFNLCSVLFCIALSNSPKLIVTACLLICSRMDCTEPQKGLWPKRWLDQLQLSSQSWLTGLGVGGYNLWGGEGNERLWPLERITCHYWCVWSVFY
jgi:hypothetical protein